MPQEGPCQPARPSAPSSCSPADHRLTLAAKALRNAGDERTLDQLRADPACALIIGRTEVTVPVQTLMGLSDRPGLLSGGAPLPASLARQLARQPDPTWHRMLTDPAGRCVELSTESYRPTAPPALVITRPSTPPGSASSSTPTARLPGHIRALHDADEALRPDLWEEVDVGRPA